MRSVLALIFFLSGASALIFESLWFRLAGLPLGNSVWSASLVLAAFMGGLALGNGLVARLHGRVLQPVRIYAALEFAIGIGGIAVVLLLPRLPNLLGPVFGSLTELPLLLNAVRLTIAFGILLTPAIAMGATLPVLAQAISRQDPNFGANIGWLYGWNTLGAMLGAFSAELFLVPIFGILNSGVFAMALNLMAALIALQFARTHEATPISASAVPGMPSSIDMRSRRYLAVAFLSGALMLALEVVWFRFLLLTRDGTSLIFAVMLAVVLAGIAVGGLTAALLFRRDDRAYRWLRHVIAASAALVVLTYWGYDLFSVYNDRQDTSTSAFICFATFLMFPVAALSGIAFTMVNRAVKGNVGSSARTAGIATFFNTIGAMLGSLFAGFILLPMVGMELSFFLIAASYSLVAFLVPAETGTAGSAKLSGRGLVATAFACLVLFPFGLMQRTYFSPEIAWLPNHTLVTAREGLVETVRYYRRDLLGEPKYYRLLTNGHSMSATSTAAKRYMKLYVYLPLALNADTRDALLISYGVGTTAKALTDSRGLQSIDVVDISEDILDLSNVIYPGDGNPLRDERVRVHVEDGRFFLNTTSRRYDLITSEPPPPDHAGVVNLYSQEYFELIRGRLNPGGYASYWLPAEQLGPINTLSIVKAFCNAFDDCSLWTGSGLEWMLLGSNDAKHQSSVAGFSAQWRDPQVAPELVALGFESPAQMGSLFMADSNMLMELTVDIAPVADNYPSRITSGPVTNQGYVALYDALMDEDARLERFRSSEQIAALLAAELRQSAEPFFQYERVIKNHFTAGVYRHQGEPFFWETLDNLLTKTSLVTLPLWLLGSDQETQNIVTGILDRDGPRDDLALQLARKYAAVRDYETALGYVESHMASGNDASGWTLRFNLYLLAKNGLLAQSGPLINRLRALEEPGTGRFLDWFGARFELHGEESPAAATLGMREVR
jgi:spermidine synthase